MTTSSSAGRPDQAVRGRGVPDILGSDLTAPLVKAVREAVGRLDAVTAVVYLLSDHSDQLWAAMIGGSSLSIFALQGQIAVDAPSPSADALRSGTVVVRDSPKRGGADERYVQVFPYAVAAAPVAAAGHRFGTLEVLRPQTEAGYDAGDRAGLQETADRLGARLSALAASGTPVRSGSIPVLVPAFGDPPDTEVDPGWGVAGVPGSAGMSFMYPLGRLADAINRAATMDDVMAAAQVSVGAPFGADSLVIASVGEGRLWVGGHSGSSARLAQSLHGSSAYARRDVADAIQGRPHFPPVGDPRPAADKNSETSEDPDHPGAGPAAEVFLPLVGSEEIVGVFCLTFAGSRRFTPEEKAVLAMMAVVLGPAVQRVELGQKRKIIAESLQKSLLPRMLSEVSQLTTTARYRASAATSEVGGDWYDVIKLPDERVVLVVGDVEGHSMESAAVMGQLRSAVVAYATEGHRPATVIDRTSRLLGGLGTELLATCCVVLFDPDGGQAEVALAGHPAPLVRRPDGSIGTLAAPSNVPLGVEAPAPYRPREYRLQPESVLMLYTNGLTDGRAADPVAGASALLSAFGREAQTYLETLADHMVADLPGPDRRRDDAVLLLASYEGAGRAQPSRTGRLHIQRYDLQGVKSARRFVNSRLDAWGLAEMSDDLQLIISEVVTNAIIHAGSSVDVRLRAFADHVRLEVGDFDSNPPVPSPLTQRQEENSEAEHGRGLIIVEALARAWNTFPNGRGKTVWLELAIPGACGSRSGPAD